MTDLAEAVLSAYERHFDEWLNAHPISPIARRPERVEIMRLALADALTPEHGSVEPQVDVIAQAKDIAYQDGWRDAVLAARDGRRTIPPDRDPDHVHAFAAGTVLRAVEAGAKAAGVRFAS